MAVLTGDQIRRIVAALTGAYPTRADLELLVFLFDRTLDQISTQGNLRSDISRLVIVAVSERWIAGLLAEAARERPAVPELAVLAAEVAPLVAAPNADEPWRANIFNGVPLVDREPQRTALRELDKPLGSRILTVTGPATSGKSHLLNLVTWRAAVCKDELVWIDLARVADRIDNVAQPVTPQRIAESLCDQLRIDRGILPAAGEQDSRWSQVFCDRLQGTLQGARATADVTRRCWIVFDEFNSVPVTSQALDLVKELASRVGGVLTDTRLVLLGFDDLLPLNVGAALRTELGYITEAQLQQFFVALHTSRPGPPDPALIAESVRRVLDEVVPGDPMRLRRLGEQVATEARRVLAGGQP